MNYLRIMQLIDRNNFSKSILRPMVFTETTSRKRPRFLISKIATEFLALESNFSYPLIILERSNKNKLLSWVGHYGDEFLVERKL